MREQIGVSHFFFSVVVGAMGGQGAKGAGGAGVFGGGELVLSALRPRSYSSCAAGGCLGWRYQASPNVGWWLFFTIPVVVSRY